MSRIATTGMTLRRAILEGYGCGALSGVYTVMRALARST